MKFFGMIAPSKNLKHFCFDGFTRFSRHHSVEAIGRFSLDTRLLSTPDTKDHQRFKQLFADMTRQVDAARAPDMAIEPNCHQQKQHQSRHT